LIAARFVENTSVSGCTLHLAPLHLTKYSGPENLSWKTARIGLDGSYSSNVALQPQNGHVRISGNGVCFAI